MYFIQWLHYIDSNLNAIQVIYQMSSNVIKMLLKEQSSTSIQSKKRGCCEINESSWQSVELNDPDANGNLQGDSAAHDKLARARLNRVHNNRLCNKRDECSPTVGDVLRHRICKERYKYYSRSICFKRLFSFLNVDFHPFRSFLQHDSTVLKPIEFKALGSVWAIAPSCGR